MRVMNELGLTTTTMYSTILRDEEKGMDEEPGGGFNSGLQEGEGPLRSKEPSLPQPKSPKLGLRESPRGSEVSSARVNPRRNKLQAAFPEEWLHRGAEKRDGVH